MVALKPLPEVSVRHIVLQVLNYLGNCSSNAQRRNTDVCGLWCVDERFCFPMMIYLAHGSTHCSKEAMVSIINQHRTGLPQDVTKLLTFLWQYVQLVLFTIQVRLRSLRSTAQSHCTHFSDHRLTLYNYPS